MHCTLAPLWQVTSAVHSDWALGPECDPGCPAAAPFGDPVEAYLSATLGAAPHSCRRACMGSTWAARRAGA